MKIDHTIHIAAPPSLVWDVTVDIDRWPEWTPTVTAVRRLDDGPFDVGTAALITQPGLPASRWTVTALDPGRSFSWEARVRGLHLIATHELTPEDGGTRCTLRIESPGLLARLIWPVFSPRGRSMLRQENEGLKARCEEQA